MRSLLSLAVAAFGLLTPGMASARDCRPADVPPGVRLPDRPGCRAAAAASGERLPARPGRTPGFIDLGNGTEVRISGRVRAEGTYRR